MTHSAGQSADCSEGLIRSRAMRNEHRCRDGGSE
jgi:hypothetical protein